MNHLTHNFANGPRVKCLGDQSVLTLSTAYERLIHLHGEMAVKQKLLLMQPAPTREHDGFGEIHQVPQPLDLCTVIKADGAFVPDGIGAIVVLQVADCAPVVIYVPGYGTYILHCGRPALAPRNQCGHNLLTEAFILAGYKRDQPATGAQVWVGPHISWQNFPHPSSGEGYEEHVAPFEVLHNAQPDWGVLQRTRDKPSVYIDLQRVIRFYLERMYQLSSKQICWQNPCTYQDTGWASYRRHHGQKLTRSNLVVVTCR